MISKLIIIGRRLIKNLLLKRNIVSLDKLSFDAFGAALARAVEELAMNDEIQREEGAEGIVFSKDRPLQLHALLKSYFELTINSPSLFVIYDASTPEYGRAYDEIKLIYSAFDVQFIVENGFRDTLIQRLSSLKKEKVFFLVDDVVFIRPVNYLEYLDFEMETQVPSLRLSTHLEYCYTLASKQKTPEFIGVKKLAEGEGMLTWHWEDGQYDWSYPLSVDGNCFRTDEVLVMSKLVDFLAPNSFETALQCFQGLYLAREGVCYESSRIVNIPFNKVQTENSNFSAGVSLVTMLGFWDDGFEIDIDRYKGMLNKSAHQEMKLYLRERG